MYLYKHLSKWFYSQKKSEWLLYPNDGGEIELLFVACVNEQEIVNTVFTKIISIYDPYQINTICCLSN